MDYNLENEFTPPEIDSNVMQVKDIVLNADAQKYTRASARWAKFFSMIGYFSSAALFLLLIIGIIFFATREVSTGGFVPMLAIMLPFIAGYLLPSFFLAKYSKALKSGLSFNKPEDIAIAQKHLKNAFLFFGIISILLIISIIVFFSLILYGAVPMLNI